MLADVHLRVCVWLQDHLLAVKARLHTSLEAAVDEEHEDGNKRLQAKQASAGNNRQPERIHSKLCSQGSNQSVSQRRLTHIRHTQFKLRLSHGTRSIYVLDVFLKNRSTFARRNISCDSICS
jgi:hypothetical protein